MSRLPYRPVSYLALLLLGITLAACQPPSDSGATMATTTATTTDRTEQGYSLIAAPSAEDPLQAHIYQLDNGLTVYLSENHQEPRFYAEIAVRAGSKHDPADATGLAHYLEHLLFKGTREMGTLDYAAEAPYLEEIAALYEVHFAETDEQRRAELYAQINALSSEAARYAVPNEIDKLYSSMGATGLNAHTWHEETVYRVELPANRLRQWAALESHRFTDPVFRLFHTELEVVYEEKNRTLDNRDRLSSYALAELLYPTHPYGQQTTIGDSEHLKNPSLRYIQDYFDTWYVPNNMAISISGAIDPEETIEIIAEAFSAWEAAPLPEVGPWDEEPITSVRRETVHYPGEEEVQIAFRTVPQNHPDQEALMMLDMVLDNRTAGLINLNLNQQQRVRRAGSSPSFHNDHGAQHLWGVPREGQTLEEVEGLLLEQIEQLRNGEFDEDLLPAIVNDFRRMEMASLESNRARAAEMREAFLHHTDWAYHLRQQQRLAAVTAQDVVEVANRYFDTGSHVAVYRRDGEADIPDVEKPRIDPVDIDPEQQSDFARRLLAMPVEPIEPRYLEAGADYRAVEYAPGVELLHVPNPLNELFTFSITVDKGTEAEKRLSLAADLLDKASIPGTSASDLQRQWYGLGSDFSVSTGASSTRITLSGLDARFAESLSLMLTVLNEATAEDSVLADLKAALFKDREDQRQDPASISNALYLYNRYGEQSPFLDVLSREQVEAATVEELLPLIRTLTGYRQQLAYVGSLPLDEVRRILQEHYPVTTPLREPPPYEHRRARPLENNEILLIARDTAQAQVRIESTDVDYDPALTVPASVYDSYFGLGMSSVVFQELREARALAYSAAARYAQGTRLDDENLLLGVVGTQNDKAVEATATFLTLFDELPVSAARFNETLEAMISRSRSDVIGFRQIPAALRSWAHRGINSDPRPARFAELRNMTLEEMSAFHRAHVADKPRFISIVGDIDRMNRDELGNLGTIRELEVDDVFSR